MVPDTPRSRDLRQQVNIVLNEQGACVLLESQILHQESVTPDEGPIIDSRTSSGEAHPAIDRAIDWAKGQGYDVAVILW